MNACLCKMRFINYKFIYWDESKSKLQLKLYKIVTHMSKQ